MDTLIPKSQMTEEDVKLNFITPALVNRGWNNKITMETMVKFTDGKINLRGNFVNRSNPKNNLNYQRQKQIFAKYALNQLKKNRFIHSYLKICVFVINVFYISNQNYSRL